MDIEDIRKIEDEKINEVLEGGELLKVKDDRTFKVLFNELDKDGISWFMSKILEKPIDKIKNVIKEKNSSLKPLNRYDKGKHLDFFVEIGDEIVLVELNNNTGYNYTRNLYYTFHAILNSVTVGSKYKKIHAVLVNLNWFKDKYKNINPIDIIEYPYPIIGKEKAESIITVKNINLSYFDKISYNGVEMKDFLWKLFTISKYSEIEDIKTKVKELSHYCNELKRISESREFCMLVWDERMDLAFSEDYHRGKGEGYDEGKKVGLELGKKEGLEEGKKKGIEEGKKKGLADAKKEMVENFYKNGVSIDIISKSTGLSKEEIEKIIKSNN